MGWKERDRVSERREFVRLAEAEDANMTELCLRFGVSRKTGYKWLKRWESGLEDHSRRPRTSKFRTDEAMELRVVELRTQHPKWGGRKIRQVLIDQGVSDVPTSSTITRIPHRHGLISPAESHKHTPFTSFEKTEPNDLWQVDFKGDFELTRGGRCYPLTLLDDHSRFSLGVIACDNQRGVTVKDHFRQVFRRYGIPRAIYVDNGNPWGTSRERTRHSRFSTWLMRQDIEVEVVAANPDESPQAVIAGSSNRRSDQPRLLPQRSLANVGQPSVTNGYAEPMAESPRTSEP